MTSDYNSIYCRCKANTLHVQFQDEQQIPDYNQYVIDKDKYTERSLNKDEVSFFCVPCILPVHCFLKVDNRLK